jgi:bifunctional UDP-N-acetylglucosamine pyrophosphorylase/glucosamine-1-phosphate N-acetyltransferase
MAEFQLHALILAAGQGTRMKSSLSKVLHRVLGRPMLAYPVSIAHELGAASTVVVVGHQAETVKAAFAGTPVKFALQAEQRGTGHAVICARGELPPEGTVLILTGDTPLLQPKVFHDFIAAHRTSNAVITVLAADYPDPTGYGRVVTNAAGEVERIVEHKDASEEIRRVTLCNTGMYLCDIAVMNRLLDKIQPNNAQNEYYLTDILSLAREEGLRVGAFRAPDHRDFLGVNDRVQLAEAARILQARIVERHQRAGVTFYAPDQVFIEAGVVLEPDVEIEAGVHLAGTTVIAGGCRIEMGCRIEDTRIGPKSHIKAYSVLEQSELASGCIIGPMAHLRPATVLEENVHVGNYVETKKTRLGKGSKANHLTYLGDADIGAGVNVGAGTITCNYDGVNKHKTVIEDGAFIGSDTQLVAPVRVGKNAIVGAGTTVTRDVPEDALAVSRAPQKDIAGYRKRKKASAT